MLLDRQADVHLAKRCAADGYLVKPLEPTEPQAGGAGKILAPPDEPAPLSPLPPKETTEEEPAPVG